MKREIIYKGRNLFPIGIGTWGIGGFMAPNRENNDTRQIDALVYMLRKGMNYIDIGMWFAEGKSVELLSKAIQISNVRRADLVITQGVLFSYTKSLEEAQNEVQRFITVLKTDHIDNLQFSLASSQLFGINESYDFFLKLCEEKLCNGFVLTNADSGCLKAFHLKYQEKLFGSEIGLNFEIRENVNNGVVEYANLNNILNIVFQPLRRNRTALRNWPLLIELASKYGKTQNQVILNWLCSKGCLPITKSETIAHIDEIIGSLDFEISPEDIEKIDMFRPPNYITPKVYYGKEGDGIKIDQLSNVFDEDYDKASKK